MFFILRCKIKYFTKETFKFLGISIFAFLVVAILININFELKYSVTYLGKDLGYVKSKYEVDKLVEEALTEKGDNIAFLEISEVPTYELKFVRKEEATEDKDIIAKAIEEEMTLYYKVYAITLGDEIYAYTKTFEDSEQLINEMNEKYENLSLSVSEEITAEEKELKSKEEISSMIVSKKEEEAKELAAARLTQSRTVVSRSKSTNRGTTAVQHSEEAESEILNMSFLVPVSGTRTSRFGGYRGHTGLDIATAHGTNIVAAAGGTVTFAGWSGGYGNLLIISHGNGIQTYYAHCSSLDVSVGTSVGAGESIAKVGSTGNSTGNHLHLEIRINGRAVNPESYI